LVVIEMDLEARVEHTYSNYILGNLLDWQARDGEAQGFQHFANELRHNLETLQRRLGGYRFTQLASQMDVALALHQRGNPDGHRAWIRTLLEDYYDPMYAYQLGQKSERVQFRGSYMEVMDYLKNC
jgi:tRNA 2-selenouridine synthase